jgi:hypothetical protein
MLKAIKNILKNSQKLRLMPLFSVIFVANIFPMIQPESQQKPENLSQTAQTLPFNLDTYHYKSASVFPIYRDSDNQQCVILTREGKGKDKYTFDDFSGGREAIEKNPTISAAREFHEEAVLQQTLGWNVEDAEAFIDPRRNNTLYVIAYSKDPKNQKGRGIKNVTYIVNFDKYAADMLFNNFYQALTTEKERNEKLGICKREQCTLEKDRIASVLYNDLVNAIIDNKNHVQANILDPKTNRFYTQEITLRPFLVSKLRPYFLNLPYEQGENEKIRHYKIHRQ